MSAWSCIIDQTLSRGFQSFNQRWGFNNYILRQKVVLVYVGIWVCTQLVRCFLGKARKQNHKGLDTKWINNIIPI